MIRTVMITGITALTIGGALAQSPEESQLTCLIEPSRSAEISSAVAGVVKSVAVERGDVVRADQVLVELESDVERALFDLAVAKKDFTERRLRRNREMMDNDMLSDQEQDEILTEARVAQLEARAAEHEIARRTVKSPIDGVIVARDISPGEYVSNEAIIEVAGLDPLYAEIVLRSDSFGQIQTGMRAVIEIDEPINESRTGEVTLVDRTIDPGSGTFAVRVTIPNPDMAMPSGVTCELDRIILSGD